VRALLAPLVAGLLFLMVTGARLVLEKEYLSWAPALALLLVRLAGWLHPIRRKEWSADVRAVQGEGGTGLWEAAGFLAGAPWLTLRRIVLGLLTDGSSSRDPPSYWKMQHYRHDS